MGSSPAEIAFVISPQQQGIEMRLTDRRHGAFFYLACGKHLLSDCLRIPNPVEYVSIMHNA